ncbi:accessory Sec system protein Asp2 [Limosilactobacillus antri]|uniref:accessory Sec system protein Asp2 n=1 Tax=Limosilactobacillus antri TaxID=227943 RepID=UPI001F591922|nr:accessory Sec system protein Asp2 [Limosilactobacillus antri]
MNVLQLGGDNWAEQYQIPSDIKWEFNAYPVKDKKRQHRYDVLIFTGEPELTGDEWFQLQWLVDPYKVFCLPKVKATASRQLRLFLQQQKAAVIDRLPQDLIADLIPKYYTGQSGLRILPGQLLLNPRHVPAYRFVDGQHVDVDVDAGNQWQDLGTYEQNLFIDPHHLIKFWLEYQGTGFQLRLRIFIQPNGGDGDVQDCHYLEVTGNQELELPIAASPDIRFACIGLEVRGSGKLRLGVLHSRWSRAGHGAFLTGGERIVDPAKHEDVAYYFNPGDMRPPLNVYFSGARGLEGFEAYPLFRNAHAPSLLFTDMRLEIGQFYTGPVIEEKIKQVIREKLAELGLTNHELIMNGISMGTYPAMKLGMQLSAYAINVAKPIANLGYVAERGRLQRPDEFATIFDIDAQIARGLDEQSLRQLDEEFWRLASQADLTATRLFISVMNDDDYDNRALTDLRSNSAVQKAKQFSYKGFGGRHNDDPASIQWFAQRVAYLTGKEFKRSNVFNE